MTYRNRYIQTLTIILTVLLAGGSSTLHAGTGVVIKGSVYGGGNEADVMTTTTVTMSAGTVQGNIYGGGNLGDVGTIEKPNPRAYAWTGTDGTANNAENPYAATNTGVTHVNITGGILGIVDGALSVEHGNVFGGGKGYAETFWCEKGMVYSTDVRITNVTQNGSVYGGGELGRVETDTKVTIGPESGTDATDIKGSVFGAGQGVATHGYSALVRGNTDVKVRNGAKVEKNVYGGGEIASVGKYNVDANGMPYSLANNGSGTCRVEIPGRTQILGDIFGGGKGVEPLAAYLATETYTMDDKPKRMTIDGEGNNIWLEYTNRTDYLIYLQTLALATETVVTIDPGATDNVIQSTKGNVYGGSENGIVQHSTLVTVQGNCQIGDDEIATSGNIYGGGKGLEGNDGAGQVSGDAVVNINNGKIIGSVYGGGVLGATKGNVTVNINNGTVKKNVYGGGAYAHTNTSNWGLYVEVTEVPTNPKTAGLYEMSFGGIYTVTTDETAVENKTYYSKLTSPSWANSEQKSAVNQTHVNLRGGAIEGDVYGGALGDADHEPYVYGDITVDLNSKTCTDGSTVTDKTASERGCVVTQVFGCNNAKGTPKGDVLVHVYATQNSAATHIANQGGDTDVATKPKVKGRYDVQAVYGGGNQAAYNPVAPATNKTQVVIDGCDYTSIDYVYGGGNAAPVPSTEVTVNSCYEINTLFGGGNGSGSGNPGADVGIINPTAYAADTSDPKTAGTYGTGRAVSKLYGGEIHVVYGGSNEKGNIVGGTSIEVNKETASCELKVGQIYGAGNNAKMDGGTDIVMGCMPAGVIEEIYAGARNADVSGDVKLTITSGKFGRVFGGNKHGGKLQGSITVNVEETGSCQEPLIIGELYGGGNLADYSIYGYNETTGAANETGSRLYADPKLNIHAFTSIGAIYGGGYRAKMVANPTVDINVVKGSHATTAHAAGTIANIPTEYKDGSEIKNGDPVNLSYPAHEANKIGAINNVFGGGNLAEIVGDATVNIGTETKIYFKTEPTQFRENTETALTPVAEGTYAGLYEATVEGAIIKGSVYGGGNEANITGNTQVNICAKYDETAKEYRRVAPGTAGVTIDQDVFGAGKGIATDATTALVSGNTTIWMMGADVKQSVYGGGELSQVGGNTYITVKGGTIGKNREGASDPYTYWGGETYGNVYGGGKGNKDNNSGAITDATLVAAGLIKGNTNITIDNIVATAGNATYYGVSEGTIVSRPVVLHNIYGGGAYGSVGTFTYDSNLPTDLATGSESTGKATITITGGTIGIDGKENGMVFGSSRGDVGEPNDIHDKLAWVNDTEVIIGSATSSPAIKGSVYGSGENGHTLRDASVAIHNGTIGIHDTDADVTYHDNPNNPSEETYKGKDYNYPYRGNVYGGGCGTDKYDSDSNGTLDAYNPKAGIVGGNVTLLIDGGQVVRHVYGGGAMGSVIGTTAVTIGGTAVIGVNGNDNGNVYAASRGEVGLTGDYATVGGTTLNISGGEIKGSAFGGGQAGVVKGSVAVNVSGGVVKNDVYGGGALAHTNTDNWNGSALSADGYHVVTGLTAGESYIMGLYTAEDPESLIIAKDATAAVGTTYYRHGTTYNTTLNLTGGVVGNAYGGGLGQKTGINDATSDIEANVYGDVSVMVNGTAFTAEDDTYSEYWKKDNTKVTLAESSVVPRTGRVFGCNNLNGTPKGNVTVSVRRTRQYDAEQRKVVDGHVINKYEIRGVYGGGNLSHYVPADGKKTSVDVHNCEETSIEKVYGGGNSADVPTTDVTIYGCFDIHYVFGGGNGADVIWRNNRWEENDGANVTGDASVVLKGGTISDAFIGSDTKGNVHNATANVTTETGGDCTLKLTNFYGSSKRAPVYGDVNIKISACSQDDIENVYGGSYDAQIYGSITMTVTSGILKNVFGGNDRLGTIGGNITINIEEADDCKPIIIQNLYGGGFNAPYPGTGAKRITNDKDPVTGYYTGTGVVRHDDGTYDGLSYADVTSGNITINIKSCTHIENIYGGGLGTTATVTGNTEVNINMIKGSWAAPTNKTYDFSYESIGIKKTADSEIKAAIEAQIPNIVASNINTTTKTFTATIKDEIGTIGNIYGGGDAGNINGNATVNIDTKDKISHLKLTSSTTETVGGKEVTINTYVTEDNRPVLGAHITGNVFGGGNVADVTGNTKVYICTADGTTKLPEGDSHVTVAGNVFGGGKGNALLFTCEKAMVGTVDHGYDLSQGNTEVVIGDGSVGGSVFGGGMIGRVENNTSVKIGLETSESRTKKPEIAGNVFGAGQGIKTHGYSALVRGKSTVTIGGETWVKGSVYGGGDMSSVGRFWVKQPTMPNDAPTPPSDLPMGMPYALKDLEPSHKSGTCQVTIKDYAEIGPDDMTMPTFSGHVFGAGKGALPEYHSYTGTDIPERMQIGNSWDSFGNEAAYITFIETLGMSAETDVTIQDHAFVKGSVYGGSENGHVLNNTYVKIQGGQIGAGYNYDTSHSLGRYDDADFIDPKTATAGDITTKASILKECHHWPYGQNQGTIESPKWVYLPYDLYNLDGGGNPKAASDGHTFYGNVFGGGSGYFPYRCSYAALDGANVWQIDDDKSEEVGMPVDANGYSDGKWLRSAGSVGGNTRVDISGGHILTSVYGGNEQTDVGTYRNSSLIPEAGTGTCTVNMTGGTLGVPRTLEQIHNHPVTCYLFGAGKGDQRINFNTWTNVGSTSVNISGNARIYGSTFGGGEDGHVIGHAVTTIGTITVDETTIRETGDSVRIGTWGTSYVDGNVFGGGRGFSGDALTAGTVGGNVTVNINGGKMLGSIYGGGRLASVGTYFENPTLANGDPDPLYGQFKEDEGSNTYGHVTVNISGGTIGNGRAGTAADLDAKYYDMKYSGNVFGGSMGRLTLLDNTINPIWPELAQAKTSIVNISGDKTHITRNVYGGGEYGIVRENAWVTIGGRRTTVGSFATKGDFTADGAPTIDGCVYGGGFGSDDHEHLTTIAVYWNEQALKYTYTPMQWAGCVGGDTYVSLLGGTVKQNVYGGGQLASVGLIDYNVNSSTPVGVTTTGTPNYTQLTKHDGTNYIVDPGTASEKIYGFALSWPYEFTYISCNPTDASQIGGKTTVTVNGGRVGDDANVETTGYVYGGGKGQVAFGATDAIAEQRYTEAFCANVRETSVTIGDGTSTPRARTVYGGGEDGHVYHDAHVTINSGTIDRSVFGGGKGTSPFTTYLWNTASPGNPKGTTDNVHSWTAGKVYGNTSVTMNGGSVGWFIYGGGNMASVGKGNYAGGQDDYSTAGYGELPPIDNQALWTNTDFMNSGKSTVTILGGKVGPDLPDPFDSDKVDRYINADGIPYGSVFGGSRGQAAKSVTASPRYRYMPDFFLGYVNNAVINIGGTTETGAVDTDGPTIEGSVYGGGQDGHVRNSTKVKIFKGSITGQGAYETAGRSGNVFGAGSGIGKYTDGGKDYCNNSSGSVTCTTEVEVRGGSIVGSIYGGGALASVGPYKSQTYNEFHAPKDNHKSCSYTRVDIKGGAIGGSVFGASRGPSEAFLKSAFTDKEIDYNQDMFATDIWSDVYITGGTIDGNVYGGGEGGRVAESTTVTLTGGVIGTASAGGDVYGGGKGTLNLAANVGGNASVELNPGKTGTDTGCILRRIFGCNDLNGTPKGHVSVHVYATQHRNKLAINDLSKGVEYQKYEKFRSLAGDVDGYTISNYKVNNATDDDLAELATAVGIASEITAFEDRINTATNDSLKKVELDKYIEAIAVKKYDVLAVYGGGNLAPYVPTNINSEVASVVIEGCQLTSIKQVYGGGNAAFVPATSVRINEAYEIDEVFGGGNGKDNYLDPRDTLWYQNPGANVGYEDFTERGTGSGDTIDDPILRVDKADAQGKDPAIRAKYKLGSGVATTTVTGGRLHFVYGGSNKRGNISNMVMSVYQESGTCDLNVDKSYGAGKDAPTDATPVMKMDCVSNMDRIFGGSTNADVYNDIVLTITNGTFLQVFGGNDTDGAVYGSITVNIEEGGCQPIRIDELYAGGYLAPYSIYGYEINSDGSYKRDNGKLIPLKSGTNPKNDPCINVISASYIGDIYGGGYQADIVGSPHVNVNMKAGKVEVINKGTEEAPVWKDNQGEGTTYTSDITDEISYYISDEGLRIEVEKVEGTAPDLDYNGTPDEGYTVTESGKTYVYKNGETYYKVADVKTRTRHWAALDLGTIDNIYGGGNEADIYGDTHIEIGTGKRHNMSTGEEETITPARNAAVITGTVFGGGDEGDVSGNTYITLANGSVGDNVFGGGHLGTVGTFVASEHRDYSFTDADGNPNGTDDDKNTGVCNVTITGGRIGPETPTADKGNVFGAGMGSDADYYCEEAMAYGTNVNITNGTVTGNVYGGGKIARLENNTMVTIGLEGEETSAPEIKGDVFAAGKGVETHGYSALVRGNPTVTVQGKAKVLGSVYGGGEIASVARYQVVNGSPVAVDDVNSGFCKVIVRDYAEIGPDGMQMKKFDGEANPLPPDDKGHIFGAGKGVLPRVYDYSADDDAHRPKRMLAKGTTLSSSESHRVSYDTNNDWEYFGNDADYHGYIETLALSSNTDVTIGGHAFVKGSVYGGSENGIVQYDTHVTIKDTCQIGCGEGKTGPYSDELWTQAKAAVTQEQIAAIAAEMPECAHWDYVKTDGAPYDKYATAISGGVNVYDYTDYSAIPSEKRRTSSDGGKPTATDGHTYYGNVYGGGSGVIPYAPGLWHRAAGIVRRNTTVDITGGHILTSVYGGNEHTDVGIYTNDAHGEPTVPVSGGKCTVNMVGGTLGVPRTLDQIAAHPVTCYLFGAGKGDQRIFFNTWTNIREAEVNITGNARIYGSVFGGGEDGHVIENAKTNIGDTVTIGGTKYFLPATITTETPGVVIGTTGTSYVDGNVFGAGRGYSGEALTAGSIGGNVDVNISGGKMLGSIYGGGRLASVGIGFNAVSNASYGQFKEDEDAIAATYYTASEASDYNTSHSLTPGAEGSVKEGDVKTPAIPAKPHGHVTVNITGGTIGNDTESLALVKHTKGGNVFGGSMGRLELLDGTTPNPMWPQLGQVKTSAVNISGTAVIKSNVYGGGEMGTVRDSSSVTIGGERNADGTITPLSGGTGGTVYRDVYGGGYGSNIFADDYKAIVEAKDNSNTLYFGYTPMQWAGCVGKESNVTICGGRVKKSVYGGGEMASVGVINYMVTKGAASVAANEVEFSHTTGESPTYTKYSNIVKHADESNSFALSWPYEFSYIPGYEGKTNVTITGGRIGLTKTEDDANPFAADDKDNGDVYGGSKGIAGDYKDYLFCANVGSAEVNINFTSDETTLDSVNYVNGGDCIAGAVYGGGENGHVMGDTKVTLTNGLIGHALYGGGSGKGRYTASIKRLDNGEDKVVSIYSITAGKVFGNTSVEMSGGYVVRNIFGGGTLGSVGKGNYAGGLDDYYPAGYGETLSGNLWTANSEKDNAWHFLNSGKCTVKITGGTVGYVDTSNPSNTMKDGLPYGNVFGGCRGEAAPNITNSPRYLYCPEFFLGYANETEVIIGDTARINDPDYKGPRIMGSVYGGGQDGHVRRDAHVIISKGEIGKPYTGNGTADLDSPQWLHRGNVYGAGSGISLYKYDFNYDDDTDDNGQDADHTATYHGKAIKEEDYSTSAGSVTRFTQVDILGGTIHRNVYGGGSLASVGPPPIPPTRPDLADIKGDTETHSGQTGWQSLCTVNIWGTVGTQTEYQAHYGGEVYGASRGLSAESTLGAVVWTLVKVFDGATIQGNVFGGGDAGMVKKDTDVRIGEAE